MKRLVIAGLPCPADAWLDFLDEDTSDSDTTRVTVSYTHLTLPTNREV